MRVLSVPVAAVGVLVTATALSAQVQPPPAPWRGAGATPCVASDGGVFQCPPADRVIAVRAGRLFDSNTGQLLTKQVVLLRGERIADVGPEGRITIPADAEVIDLSQATVLPGLIDAHTHMFNTPRPGMSRETSTLIAIHNLQADLRAGFTSARDMSSHGNGYADVEIRNAINEGRLDGPRFQVSGRGIAWGAAPPESAREPAGEHRGALGRRSESRSPRTHRARSRLDQAVSVGRVLVHADGRGSVPADTRCRCCRRSSTRPIGWDTKPAVMCSAAKG